MPAKLTVISGCPTFKEEVLKRAIDLSAALVGLITLSPILLLAMLTVWLQDFEAPIFLGRRVGKDGRTFNMVKLRSMVKNADGYGIDSTASTDVRITPLGHFIRRFKIDEILQLWNVLVGEMSLVGPRPNIESAVASYTPDERQLISVTPGITDLSSIVFSDEADILAGSDDPDLRYDQLIRPWKSRLGLLYVERHNIAMDLRIIFLTVIAIYNRRRALKGVNEILIELNTPDEIIAVSLREKELTPHTPPGMVES